MTDEIKELIKTDLNDIISYYDTEIKKLYSETNGGTIRGVKGRLVESIAKKLVYLTWEKVLGQTLEGFEINQKKQRIFIKDPCQFIKRKNITENEKNRIKKNHAKIKYNFSTDVHVLVDHKLAIAIECKAYTETAMLKRIIYDSMLMDEALPDATHCLFQLEEAFSSNQYYVLMSHHTRNIDVLTLLEGKRNSKKPIHKREHSKKLKIEYLYFAVEYFEQALKKFVR